MINIGAMITLCYEHIFCITGPSSEYNISYRWIPAARSSNVELGILVIILD